MEKGTIKAQGTYNEIKDHEYIQQIQEIHRTNKEEIAEANKDEIEEKRPEVTPQDQERSQIKQLSEQEVADKLEVFGGAKTQLDEKTAGIIGKLLVEDKDENINADWATYVKLWHMIGGFQALFGIFVMTTFFKCYELLNERASQEWAAATPEEQYSEYNFHMCKIGFLSLGGMILHSI